MPSFLVDLTRTYSYTDATTVEIEADSEEEAIQIAKNEAENYTEWDDMGEPVLEDLHAEISDI